MIFEFPLFLDKIENFYNKNIQKLSLINELKSFDLINYQIYISNKKFFNSFSQNEMTNFYNFTKKNIEKIIFLSIEKKKIDCSFLDELYEIGIGEKGNEFLHSIFPNFLKYDFYIYFCFQQFLKDVDMMQISDYLYQEYYIEKFLQI